MDTTNQAEFLMGCLVEFEALERKRKITYSTCDLTKLDDLDWGSSLKVIKHSSEARVEYTIPFQGKPLSFQTCVCNPEGEMVLFEGAWLATVRGNQLMVHFNPEDFLKAVPEVTIFNQVMSSLISDGLDLIVKGLQSREERELSRWLKTRSTLRNRRIIAVDSEMQDLHDSILEHRARIREDFRRFAALQELQSYRKQFTDTMWKKHVEEEYHEIKKLCPDSYTSIQFTENGAEAITPNLSIDHDEYCYDLGRFKVEINLEDSRIEFQNLDRAVNGYPHPHVSKDGMPCWGNQEETVGRLLAQEDLLGLLLVVLEFLQSYNEENPYQRIKFWDPGYNGEDDDRERYDDCRNNVDSRDCVGCGDDNCPYYDEAEARCHDDRDLDDCVLCRVSCSFRDQAQTECQDERGEDPQKCIGCEARGCSFVSNYSACFEEHEGRLCADCVFIVCPHHGEPAAVVNE